MGRGDTILLNDGAIELRVTGTHDGAIDTEIVNGGVISDHKGVNVPGVRLSMPYISERDRSDILFGAETGFDFIAASFVSRADDILEIRQLLERQGNQTIRIIAKIENAEGVKNIDEILRVSDGIMVARGDMGVEVPLEDVPVFQKLLIKKCYNTGKMVITATQMLESMIHSPRPTRAEAADVANAIYDGTSAVMLSGETAAATTPSRRCARWRRSPSAPNGTSTTANASTPARTSGSPISPTRSPTPPAPPPTIWARAAIITVTWSGTTARMLSKYRPDIPVIACTHEKATYWQLALSWGVTPLLCDVKENTDDLFTHAVAKSKAAGYVHDGDIVVITAGVPLGVNGTTNLLKVHVVGDILVTGQGVNKRSAFGRLCVARTEEEALKNFNDGDILVIPQTSNALLPILKKASGIVTERGGLNSHAAIVGMALDIPVIVFAENATAILKSSSVVEVDASAGTVSNRTRTE